MSRKDETTLSEDDVRAEHEAAVNPALHWVYLGVVLVGSVVLMLALIAVLGASAG